MDYQVSPPRPGRCERGCAWAVLLVLGFVQAAFGGVLVWSKALAALLVVLLWAGFVAGSLWQRGVLWLVPRPVWILTGLGLGWIAVQAACGLALAPARAQEAWLHWVSAGGLFLLAGALGRWPGLARWVASGIALLAAVESSYGIVEHASGREHILFWPKAWPGSVSGTYVNRNHFAGLLAVATPVAIGAAWSGTGPASLRAWPWRVRLGVALGSPHWWRRAALLGCAALSALGCALSGSRGGMLALGAGLLALLALGLRAPPGEGAAHGGRVLLAVLFAMGLAGAGLWAYGGVGLVQERWTALSHQGLAAQAAGLGRLALARAALAVVGERPWQGAGAGCFELAVLRHQDGWYGGVRIDHAHNDVLETAAELGLPVFCTLALGAVWVLARAGVRALRGGEGWLARGLVAALLAASVRACLDFDLQLGGPACLVAVVAGLLVGLGARQGPAPLRGKQAWAALGAVVLLAAAVTAVGARVLAADWLAQRPLGFRPVPAAERLAALERAIALRPDCARYRLAAVRARQAAWSARTAAALEPGRLGQPVARAGGAGGEAAGSGSADGRAGRGLLAALRAALAAHEHARAAGLEERSLADLRAARESEPTNPDVLAALALLSPRRDEALGAARAAVAAFPRGAEILRAAALGRLRWEPQDLEAFGWLREALGLAPEAAAATVRAALALGLQEPLVRALPADPRVRRAVAQALLEAGDAERAALALEGAGCPGAERARPAPPGAPGQPGWRSGPLGAPLPQPAPGIVALSPGRTAWLWVSGPGVIELALSALPGSRPAVVCLLLQGEHLGHAVAGARWQQLRQALPRAGWFVIGRSEELHGLVGPRAERILLRDARFVPQPAAGAIR